MPSAKIFKMVRFQKEIHFWKAVVKRKTAKKNYGKILIFVDFRAF